jgi:choline-sulfatase
VSASPANVLLLFSDQHNRQVLGCYGDELVHTPNLDALALRGTRFVNAYTNSPICVPARASLATGRYVHEIGAWDSAAPYDGRVRSWAHKLRDADHRIVSIGKLHFRSSDDDNGFSEEILPMHVQGGVGWTRGLLRKTPGAVAECADYASDVGPGASTYTQYDDDIAEAACHWIEGQAQRRSKKNPWVLFVSFVSPHYPLRAPEAFFNLYDAAALSWPRCYAPKARPRHPVINALTRVLNYDDYFDADRVRLAKAAYYGLVSFMDNNVGRVLGALHAAGLSDETCVVYASDHGDCLGNHGIWAKSVMYEESAGIPLIMAGPGIPQGREVDTPVSLIDCFPGIVELATGALDADTRALPGDSLLEIAKQPPEDRAVLSEYHDGGAITGVFMLRDRRFKYVHYVDHPPQLFDLKADPHETEDLANEPAHADVLRAYQQKLRARLDPEAVNAQAFADQARRIEDFGGEAAILAGKDFGFTPVPR